MIPLKQSVYDSHQYRIYIVVTSSEKRWNCTSIILGDGKRERHIYTLTILPINCIMLRSIFETENGFYIIRFVEYNHQINVTAVERPLVGNP